MHWGEKSQTNEVGLFFSLVPEAGLGSWGFTLCTSKTPASLTHPRQDVQSYEVFTVSHQFLALTRTFLTLQKC